MVVRFQGGTNAGHTIGIEDEIFKLHLLPSGILRPQCHAVIGNGVVVDLDELTQEIDGLVDSGRRVDNLSISDRANILLSYHQILDGAEEKHRGDKEVGTTGRGIGPCYSDKIARHGLRMCDLEDEDTLRQKVDLIYPIKERMIGLLDGEGLPSKEEVIEKLLEFRERYSGLVTDTSVLINNAIRSGEKVLFEGAQGSMLDIDHGTYPYVTSSNCVAGGICTGAGVPPSSIDEVIGVVKAYTTRVGKGPLPSELTGPIGDEIRDKGKEFGTTTGRPRRCGWLDLVVVKNSTRINGFTRLAVTKLDVLNGLDTLKVVTAYEIDGERIEHFPASLDRVERARPIYKELTGWGDWKKGEAGDIADRGYDALPGGMKDYLEFISEETAVPIGIVSIGKRRNETIDLMEGKWTNS